MARKRGVTYEQFCAMALKLPGVADGSSYGTPALRVKKKFMARLREPDVLVLKPVDDMEKQFLMETQPRTFFLADHYRGSDAILVRLSMADPTELRDLVERAWRARRQGSAPHMMPRYGDVNCIRSGGWLSW
ncbi:MAG: MmcQ/YjbR family DNA-binding protein [Chloroflexota bacterium]|nr:MmcQ/YjbR family DNA-binding protein [Chloroflexota bacterium]